MPIYFAVAGEFVKIGWSRDPIVRATDLQIGYGHPIRLAAIVPGGRYVERSHHLRFIYLAVDVRWGVNGPSGLPFPVNEWFHLVGELREYVDHLAGGGAPLWTCSGPEDEWYPSTAFHPPEQRDEILRREIAAMLPHQRHWIADPDDLANEDGEPIPF